MSARVAIAVGTAVGTAAATAAGMEVAEPVVAEPVVAAPELVVLGAAVPELVLEQVALVPEAVAPVRVPEVAVLEVAVLEAAVRAPVPEAAALGQVVLAREAAVLLVVPVGEARVRPELAVVLQAVAEVEQPAEAVRVAAQAEPLRLAMARPVPVLVETAVETGPLAALARRVRSVPLPARRAWALRQAVAHPTDRRQMGQPRVQMARLERPGVGRGGTSWRPLLSRRSRAPTSCVPCTSGASSLRAPQIA